MLQPGPHPPCSPRPEGASGALRPDRSPCRARPRSIGNGQVTFSRLTPIRYGQWSAPAGISRRCVRGKRLSRNASCHLLQAVFKHQVQRDATAPRAHPSPGAGELFTNRVPPHQSRGVRKLDLLSPSGKQEEQATGLTR